MLRTAIFLICISYLVVGQLQAQSLATPDESTDRALSLAERGQYKLAPYVYYLPEQDKPLNIDDLVKISDTLPWQKNIKTEVNLGFSNHAYWLKISTINHYSFNSEWALEIAYPSLDHVEAYFYDANNHLDAAYFAGDQLDVDNKIINHPHIVFPLILPAGEAYTLYLRVQTQGAMQVPLTLWQWDEFNFQTLVHFLMQGFFYGMALLMALYNSVVWFAEKKAIYLYYVAYILCLTLFQSCLNGLGFHFIWPEHPQLNNLIIPTSIALILASISYFINDFFNAQVTIPKFHIVLKTSVYLYSILAIVCIFLPYAIAVELMATFAILTVALVIILTAYMLKIKHPSSTYFFLSWLVLIFGAVLLAGNKFGFFPINTFSEYGLQVGAGLEMMILSLALADQLNKTQQGKIHAQQDSLELAHQVNKERDKSLAMELENYRLEKENSNKLEQLVSERTEELNVAMKSLSTAHDKLKTVSVTDALTQLYNRYYFNEHWRIEHKRAYREKSHLTLIMLDLDHFKQVNDHHGHPAGDMCLKELANCILQHAARDSDIVCRYGGEEFIIILPGTDQEGAMAVAEAIRQQVAALKLVWQKKEVPLTASLGVSSLIPQNSLNQDQQIMINQADQAMYQAKKRGRNQVVLFSTLPDLNEPHINETGPQKGTLDV